MKNQSSHDRSLYIQKGEIPIIVAYCLFCSEVFCIYRNFRIPADYLDAMTIPLFGGFVAVFSAFVLCVVLLLLYVWKGLRINTTNHLTVVCVVSSVIPLVQYILVHVLHQTWPIVPCIALTAASFVCVAPAMIEKLSKAGVSCTIRCNIAACLVLLVVAPFSSLVPFIVFALIMSAIPLVIWYCLKNSSYVRNIASPVEVEKGQRFPRILFLTIAAACIMEGVVAAVDRVYMGDETKAIVFSIAYIISAVAIVFVLLMSRDSYNNVIFRVCFPVMAVGISFFIFKGLWALDLGTLIFLVGRQLFAAAISALIVYMVRYLGSDSYLLSFSTVVGAMLGSFVGLALYRVFSSLPAETILPPMFLVYLILGLMLVAIYLMSASNIKTRWGMVAIDDADESVELTFEQTCLLLAEKWGLTKRESEIVELLIKGRDRQIIAEKLFISEGTVKVHTRNIYQKMGIHSKQDLIDLVEQTEKSFKE